jgi:hypothetical protein
MRVTALLPLIVLSTASVGNALSLHRRDVPAVLAAPLQRRQPAATFSKRDTSPLNVSIINDVSIEFTGFPHPRLTSAQQDSIYLLNLTLGTPAQNFTLALDTGSSDLWVIGGSKEADNVYDSSASSSFKSLDTGYNATYADGTTALGTYATDTLVLGDATIKNFQFVVANQTSSDSKI